MQVLKKDHKAVLVDVNILNNKRGKGYWKFNNSLLTEKGFCQSISDVIKWAKQNYITIRDKRVVWEILKLKIKK